MILKECSQTWTRTKISPAKAGPSYLPRTNLFPGRDSNPNKQIQNLLSYH